MRVAPPAPYGETGLQPVQCESALPPAEQIEEIVRPDRELRKLFQQEARGRVRLLQRLVGVAHQLFQTVIADHDAEVLRRDIFQLVGLIEDNHGIVRQHRPEVPLPQSKVGEEEMVVDDDDVRFKGALANERDKTVVPVGAFLSGARLPPGVEVPP